MEFLKSKEKILFWGAVAGLSTIVATSGYYLYQYITEEDEEYEKENQKKKQTDLDKVKSEIKEEEIFENGKMTPEGIVKLMTKINKLSDFFYARDYPDLDKKRRDAFDKDENLYAQLCNESLMNKQLCTQKATNEIIVKFQKYHLSMESIQEYMGGIDPKLIEELSMKYDEPDENEKNITKEKAKEAYIYYAKSFLEATTKFQAKYNNPSLMVDEEGQAQIMMEFFSLKMKLDDMLFLKYQINDQKLKGLLYRNNLLLDPEIMKYQDELDKLDKMMGNE